MAGQRPRRLTRARVAQVGWVALIGQPVLGIRTHDLAQLGR